ncbi:hypothetical protein DI392_03585 [Vibrio albus]|uniref:Uncharacterized protein n=1 Tax=Vibrio albus TaxID=2200953 RepID=A0A2U3BEZ4_9VIBR|nr:hypothetical protein DI392_03585 [Vibrio albus]
MTFANNFSYNFLNKFIALFPAWCIGEVLSTSGKPTKDSTNPLQSPIITASHLKIRRDDYVV